MKIYEEKAIRDFKFWSAAEDRAAKLTDEDWDTVESELESQYPDGIDDGKLNDLFWFEFDSIVQMLGYKDEEDFQSCVHARVRAHTHIHTHTSLLKKLFTERSFNIR